MSLQIRADINGGDAVTSKENLFFRVYNGNTLIHTTGQVNADGDVSYDTAAGKEDEVIINNIPSSPSTTYNISVAAVDEAGNEATKSNVIAITTGSGGPTQTLLLQNDFSANLNGIVGFNGATATLSGGQASINHPSGKASAAFDYAWVDGKTYKVVADIVSFSSANAFSYIFARTWPDKDQQVIPQPFPRNQEEYTFTHDAGDTSIDVAIIRQVTGDNNETLVLDNIKIYEIT